ncbi:DUF4349 domain-containing protein [Halalkalibacter alkalisediminis]|uniref:DUF4349 domain-containing protein n=1 Tax=Halalkalibacter alkalisediminis TaxID=935616 RepID=A0ABV6NFV0_9BACI|nr:DUF4349 domain-containing protein [Halalkalibacter alkalisediminis]
MSKLRLILALFGLVFVILGCSNQDQSTESRALSMDGGTEDSYKAVSNMKEMDMEMEMAADDGALLTTDFSSDRMVIHHGNILIEVNDYLKARNEIQGKVKSIGGYVVESYYHEGIDGQLNGSMIVRVPKGDFQPLLEHLATQQWKVIEQQTSGNDVTEEFVDLESRLKAKRVVEERLLGFMDKADNTENLLKISNELATVQAEIEQMLGRKQYIENQVEFSTVSIHIQENSLSATIQGENLNTWERAQKLFIETINAMIRVSSGIVVFFVGLSPILLPIALFIGAFLLFMKKRKNRS